MKNVKTVVIPFALLIRATLVLEHIDFFGSADAIQSEYDKVLFALRSKKTAVELRDAYKSMSVSADKRLDPMPGYSQLEFDFSDL